MIPPRNPFQASTFHASTSHSGTALAPRTLIAMSLTLAALLSSQTIEAAVPTNPNTSAATLKARNIESAERFAAQAFAAYGRKDYRSALTLYKQALHAAPGANILYNLARIYDLGLHERIHAMQYYRRYLDHPSSAQPRSEYAELRITELRSSAPRARHPQSPQTSQTLVAGLAASDTRKQDATAQLLTDQSQLKQPLLFDDAGTTKTPWTTKEISAAALGGAGLVSLLVAVRFGVSAYWENDSWRSECNGNVCDSQEALDSARHAFDEANRATVALAAGGGLLAVASALIWAPLGERDQSSDIAWDVQVPWGQAGLVGSISGKF